MIKRTITIPIELEPSELAFCFCEMKSDEQAEFFNEVGRIIKNWESPFPLQLEVLGQEESLSIDGRYVMEKIGECSQHNR